MRATLLPDPTLVQNRFSEAAGIYENHAEHQRRIASDLLGIIEGISPGRILELGCGTGILSMGLQNRFSDSKLLLTDCAQGMVSMCRTRVYPSSLVRHSIMDFEKPLAEEFDLVVSSCALQWLREPDAFGNKLAGMVAPGGFTAHAIPVPGMLQELRESFILAGGNWPELNYRTPEQWRSILDHAGFATEEPIAGKYTVTYSSPREALQAVKGIGATLSGHSGAPGNDPSTVRRALNIYSSLFRSPDGSLPSTYRVAFITARKT